MERLTSLWSGNKIVLVGASALSCFLDMNWRQTHDLDVSVAISLEQYPRALTTLAGWTKDPMLEPRWHSPDGVRVDIIPAGTEELVARRVVWPETQWLMNLTGFRLAFERAIVVEIGKGVSVRVAPPEVVVLLKMVAYQDRPQERERDLEDIGHVLDRLVEADADERFTDKIIEKAIAYELISPYVVGKRLSLVVNSEERRSVMEFMKKVQNEDDADLTQVKMASANPWRGDAEALLGAIRAFSEGFAPRAM